MNEAIQVQGLVKTYGSLRAVDGIQFQVNQGEVFSFLGPNGAGKTTTVEVLEGLRRATEGSVRVLGMDPWEEGRALHRRIGVIPQGFKFFDKVTPREAIRYYAALFGTRVDPDRLLKRVLLSDKAQDTFDKLSGGQRQKLGLALALVSDPEVLFLDEPTTGLDPQARRAIWDVIRELRTEGRTVFLTTHYLDEAEELADRVAILHHGRIITEGTPRDLIQRHGSPPRLLITGPREVARTLKAHTDLEVQEDHGETHVILHRPGDLSRAVQTLETHGVRWEDLSTERDSLEDVFIRLVGEMDEGEITSS